MHLRIQPPVHFNPVGSPLLLVSVLDHTLAKHLVRKGKLKQEQLQWDFHRPGDNRGSVSWSLSHFLSSTQELDLLRYSLRVKSTRMRRSVSQSKDLGENRRRGENSPWMPTFFSLRYFETHFLGCRGVDNEFIANLQLNIFLKNKLEFDMELLTWTWIKKAKIKRI